MNYLWLENKEKLFEQIESVGKSDKTFLRVNNAHNILRVLRSMKNVKQLAYISSPITTGLEYYNLKKAGEKVDYKKLIENNVFRMEDELYKAGGIEMLIPARFTPVVMDWEQEHFMYLWYSTIGEICTEVRFVKNWEYSNGCVQEFAHAKQLTLGVPPSQQHGIYINTNETYEHNDSRMRNMTTRHIQGAFIYTEEAINLITNAKKVINELGFPTEVHDKCLLILEELKIIGVK